MPEVIGGVDIPSLKIEGTPSEVATQIFKDIISPNTEMLFKTDPQVAKAFAYYIMGFAVSQYAECVSTKHFEKHMNMVVHNMVLNLKKERGELNC